MEALKALDVQLRGFHIEPTDLKKGLDRAAYCSQLRVFAARYFDLCHFDWDHFCISLRTVTSEKVQPCKSKSGTLSYAFGCN